MSMLINGKPTLHDGGSQTSPTTHFIANNLCGRAKKKLAARAEDAVEIKVIKELWHIVSQQRRMAIIPALLEPLYILGSYSRYDPLDALYQQDWFF